MPVTLRDVDNNDKESRTEKYLNKIGSRSVNEDEEIRSF